MNISKITTLAAITVAAAFFMNQAVQADDLFAEAAAASQVTKGPVTASPHGLEDFRGLAQPEVAPPEATRDRFAVPARIKVNLALLDNPRTREKYPVLVRVEEQRTTGGSTELGRILANSALAGNPRTREEYPQLRFCK